MIRTALTDLTHNPAGCDLAPDLSFYFRIFLLRVFCGGRMCLFEDPEVGGRIASSLQMSNNSSHFSLVTLFRVLFVALILSKLKGPTNLSDGCVRSNSSAH